MKFKYPKGATPIDDNELRDLIPDISLQKELNEWEQANISDAVMKYGIKNLKPGAILQIDFLLHLHKNMFNNVWKWAGHSRHSMKNIGVDVSLIYVKTKDLCEDVKYWIQNNTYPADEICVRFHHRLVQIHIFPNGNGRHSRFAADLLAKSLQLKPFSWGHADLYKEGDVRKNYISALKEADNFNYTPLLHFASS